ncbi:helix-turn-helix domain-containing protein [Streptomyces sp. NBC_00872]|uniref:AraC-like ligand-binding domain-containing protein n=1 Tax=Streptomyces sp. NBC_00872 TaxID=2903686 RepID=UPI003869307D|nr:helix-turn-helix domain-containing protein [Streptomyces sp. NBC_00872]
MIKTIFRSEDLPPEERLARFDDLQVNSVHPMRVRSDAAEDFRATARALDLGAVNVVELTCSPSDVQRTPKLIRKSDPELYSVVFALCGQLGVSQAGHDTALGTNNFAVYDSSQPFHIRIAPGHDTTTLVRAHVPRALLALPAGGADRLLAVRLPGSAGVGALLTQFLTSLTSDSGSYRPADVSRLSTVALDLLTATLAHHLDADTLVPPDSHRHVLLLSIQAFVQQHLPEPRLTPGFIAAAHHISVSYLHRLFEAHDTTVSAWIRRQRLERSLRDLTDPAQRAVPIHRIATRWGFNDHTAFTRAFRATYGIPPKDYRHHALGTST